MFSKLVISSQEHEDSGKLDDSISPTYAAWYILLKEKLEANADWWPTKRRQIHYVFSYTTRKAQSHLELG
jgi:hypothetical protein